METFFKPRNIVVFGVSESETNMARHILANCLRCEYPGDIYAVGRSGGTVFGLPIHESLDTIPGEIDLATILTPARLVPDILKDCGARGIKRIIIQSGGFGELSDSANGLEEACLDISKRFDMRSVGLNGIGTFDRHSKLMLPFSPFEDPPRVGDVTLLSQSGGVGIHLIIELVREGQGLAKFVSLGNKLDVNETDLLEYLSNDPETGIIALYLEGFSDGRRFLEAASTCPKPTVVFKSNIGDMGAKAAHSHTKALSGDDAVVTAALEQVGVYRAADTNDLLTAVKAFRLPPMRGNRVAVVSRSGGHAVIVADALEKAGFELPPYPEEVIAVAQQAFRASVIKPQNPMDVGDIFDFSAYGRIISEILKHDQFDGILFLNTYRRDPECLVGRELLSQMEEQSREHDKPIACCLVITPEELSHLRGRSSFPVFETPEEVAHCLQISRDYHGNKKTRFWAELPCFKTPRVVLDDNEGDHWLDAETALVLLEGRGVPVPEWIVAGSAEEASRVGSSFGSPVVLKALSPNILHKTEAGAIAVGFDGREAIHDGYNQLLRTVSEGAPDVEIEGVLVQEQVDGGVEIIVGARRDPTFGPIVLFGLGGIFAEALQDVSIRVAPIDESQALDMIREIRGSRILMGYRGQPKADLAALQKIILAISDLILECQEVEEIDLNPVRVYPEGMGAQALDVRIRVNG